MTTRLEGKAVNNQSQGFENLDNNYYNDNRY
jgi:hypothetical protein